MNISFRKPFLSCRERRRKPSILDEPLKPPEQDLLSLERIKLVEPAPDYNQVLNRLNLN